MERVSAIINSLKEKHESGGSKEELLWLIDQLKNELTAPVHAVNHQSPTVSIMMPAGYQPIPANIYEAIVNGREIPSSPTNVEPSEINSEPASFSVKGSEMGKTAPEIQMAAKPMPFYSAPRPPMITMVEVEDETLEDVIAEIKEEESNSKPESGIPVEEVIIPVTEEHIPDVKVEMASVEAAIPKSEEVKKESSVMDDILGFLNFSRPEKKELTLDFDEPVDEQDIENEKIERPLVYNFEPELKGNSSNNYFHSTSATQDEQLFVEEMETLEMPKEHTKPKELHEILAARIVANPTVQPEGKRMLSEKLGSSKITDLRKGIAVNDRFRFIKSLFRSDEILFDRSIKTINNFSNVAEAQYWIQRELVIKLGWNDEDELVQQFYSLVSRRFL
jgi:hypothetical protein